jgi:hypothetical protein
MLKSFNVFAALLLAAGLAIGATEAQAQPCDDVTPGEAAVQAEGSTDGSTAPQPHVGDPDMTGAEEHAAMEGSVQGSGTPMPGRGDCDEIDELPQANTEG